MFGIVRTQEEIDAELEKIYEAKEQGTKFPGMSYEDGCEAMLDWLTGRVDYTPMEE